MLGEFPSAISRYLDSNRAEGYLPLRVDILVSIRYIAVLGLQPAALSGRGQGVHPRVSIRYIAVLGLQQGVSLEVLALWDVSIRYIAVLGFQLPERIYRYRMVLPVSIRYIAVLGFQHL